MTEQLNKRLLRAVPWAMVDAAITALLGFLTIILIGRFISPTDFGQATVALSIVLLAEAIPNQGLQEATINLRAASLRATDTAATLALALSFLGVIACVAVSFPLASAFENTNLIVLVAVASITLPINALCLVPTALLTRKMRAAALTKRFLFGKVAGLTVLAISCALNLGPWAIITASIATSAGHLVVLLATTRRWPRLHISRGIAANLLRFGMIVGLDGLFWILSARLFGLLFGYFHGLSALGNLQFALRLVDEISRLLQSVAAKFGMSYFAGLTRTDAKLADAFQKGSRILNTIAIPAFAGFSLISPQFVPLLFGPSWNGAIPFLQIFSLTWIFTFSRVLVSPTLKALDKPGVIVRYSALNFLLVTVGVIATGGLSPLAGVLAWSSRELIAMPWNWILVKRYLQINIGTQFMQVSRPILMSAPMVVAVILVQYFFSLGTSISGVTVSILTGSLIYILVLWLFERTLLVEIWMVLSKMLRSNSNRSLPGRISGS